MKNLLLLIIGASCLLTSCSQSPTPAQSDRSDPPSIYTTFYPLQLFSQRIAGDYATVTCPLPQHTDPIFWQPTDTDISAFQSANHIVINGAGFEQWIPKVNLPTGKIIDTSTGLKDPLIHYEQASTHSHGPTGEHAHEGLDGHTWLDPISAQQQAKVILDALCTLAPAQETKFTANYEALSKDLAELDKLLSEISQRPLLASHPAYNYLARRYDWQITNMDLDPESIPDQATLQKINTHPATVILWESAPSKEVATAIKVNSIVFSPCEQAPTEGDYFDRMKQQISALKSALQ